MLSLWVHMANLRVKICSQKVEIISEAISVSWENWELEIPDTL